MNKYFLALIIISCSCRSVRCTIDENIVNEFKQKINLIRSAEEKNVEVLVDDYLSALTFLGHVTGKPSRAEYSSTFGYRNDQYYKEDMKAWEELFNKNNCKLKRSYVDSALSKAKYIKRDS